MKKTSTRMLALLMSIAMCMSMLVMAAGCSKKPDGEPAVSVADVEAEPSGLLYDENDVPYIYESFENPETIAIPRYNPDNTEFAMEVIDLESGGKALKISGRGDSWNGANFPAEVFSGNVISYTAHMSCVDSTMIISSQWDLNGVTTYTNLASTDGASSITELTGTVDIPEGAKNVFVYVESNGLSDIIVDDIKVEVVGDYIVPKEEEVGFVDFSDYPSLKEVYDGKFTFGCAMPVTFVGSGAPEYLELITQQFNTITLENELKPDAILDFAACSSDPAKYNEAPAVNFERIIPTLDYCKQNGIMVRGHTLLWHEQTPEWLFHENYDIDAGYASREIMLARMENYIKSVLTWAQDNYPGLFYAWDVVNEACEDGDGSMRKLNWYNTVGEDYVQKAFEFARKYCPDGVKLFYNDYNAFQTGKRNGIIEMLKPVAEAGNIDGVGMQAHISTAVNVDFYMAAAKTYADELGVVINITELDVAMPGTDNAEYDQGVFMQNFFSALLDAQKKGLPIEAVTVWGICDPLSWKSSDKPVLFNGDLSRKLAFEGVVCAATGEEVPKPLDYAEPGEPKPIVCDYEGSDFPGKPRATCALKIVKEDSHGGSGCLRCSDGTDTWDGYSINVTEYLGKKFEYSFAIKSTCDECRFSADIDGVWPNIEQIDTSSGEWIECSGTLRVPLRYDRALRLL